jgi:dATP pyrophosphohydrolase
MQANPRRPESILVVVYTDNADILLLKRSQPFAFWQSVTGSLEAGESPAEAAHRELLEETGLADEGQLVDTGTERTFTIDPRWRDRYAADITENTEHEWHYRLPAVVEIDVDNDEHSDYHWFEIDAAIEAVWSWTNKEALESLKATLV